MKQFIEYWLAWAAFVMATVSIAGAINRYVANDLVLMRDLFVWIVISLLLAAWWHLIRK